MRIVISILAAAAGVFGAAGVSLAAIGAHVSGNPNVTIAAHFLLFHASALLGFCALARDDAVWALPVAAGFIAVGVCLFSGDLALRALAHLTLIHMAAPTGGVLMIVGWLVAAVALPASIGQSIRVNPARNHDLPQ